MPGELSSVARWWAAGLVAVLGLSACVRAGFSAEGLDGAPPAPDAAQTDGARDQGSPDHDGASAADLLQLDGEQPDPDLAPDPDQLVPDLAPDPDQQVLDTGFIGFPCISGSTVSVDAKMVFCVSTSAGVVDQCSAEATFCNVPGGWHLCTATEYRTRFVGAAPPVTGAWIASCIRDGAAPIVPTDSICQQCVSVIGPVANHSFSCTTGSASGSGMLYMGVESNGTCHRLGTNAPANAAYWAARSSYATSSNYAAACCLP